MRNLVVNTFLTLDGVMQAPGGPEEDPTGGFRHGGWAVSHSDEEMGEEMAEWMGKLFDLVLGRLTYEIFAAHWPHVGQGERAQRGGTASEVDDEAAAALNSARKYVASSTLNQATWNNSTILEGDVPTAIERVKREEGPELQIHGSGGLIRSLLPHGLIDAFRLWTFPVLVGPGKRLFADGTAPAALRLVDSRVFDTGVVLSVYEPAGDVEHGSFAFEEPPEEELARRQRLAGDGD